MMRLTAANDHRLDLVPCLFQFRQNGLVSSIKPRGRELVEHAVVRLHFCLAVSLEFGVPIRTRGHNHLFDDFGKLIGSNVNYNTAGLEPGVGMGAVNSIMSTQTQHV